MNYFTQEDLIKLGYQMGQNGEYYARATERARNIQNLNQGQMPKLESSIKSKPKRPTKAKSQTKATNQRSYRIEIIAYHRRYIDPDNLAPKWGIDALRGIAFPDDSSEYISKIDKRVVKIDKSQEERWEIVVYELFDNSQ